jgi:hypothetical protein
VCELTESCDEDCCSVQKTRSWTDSEVRAVAAEISDRIKLFTAAKGTESDASLHAPLSKQVSPNSVSQFLELGKWKRPVILPSIASTEHLTRYLTSGR